MKTFFVDSNIFLRFVLKDHPDFWNRAKNYFLQAKLRKIKLIFLTEIIIEIEYFLRKLYQLPKKVIYQHLCFLIKIPYLEIRNKAILEKALQTYLHQEIDLVDLVLFYTAQQEQAKVLSFDKDFEKLDKF